MRADQFNGPRTRTVGRIVIRQDTTLAVQQTATVVFWLACFQEYSLQSDKAIDVLLPFSTTYLCETAFSAVTAIKTKYRSRLDIEHDIRVCLSRIPPRLDKLCSAKQAQPSHWTKHCTCIMNILLIYIFGDCLIFETEVISACAMTFKCCARNLAFSRIQVVLRLHT